MLELLGLGPERLDDVKMAVSEACNNVVLHAYGDRVGPLFVELELSDGEIGVVVRDRGSGLARTEPAEGRLGVGLPMMQTLADDAQFRDVDGGGTEVRLMFGWDSEGLRHLDREAPPLLADPASARPAGEVVVWHCPVPMLAGVLGRLATILAAAARFSLDRLSDVRLLTDAVAARVEAVSAEPVTFALATTLRRLELALGPLAPGTGGQLVPERSSLTASSMPLLLADEWRPETSGGGAELVRVVITDSRGPRSDGEWVGST